MTSLNPENFIGSSAKQPVYAYAYNINTDYKSKNAKKISYTNKVMCNVTCARGHFSKVYAIDLVCTQKLPFALLWDICVEHKRKKEQ